MTETGQIRRLGADATETDPFWKTKRLDEMTPGEWESLCDGCGKCCLTKLEDADTGEIHWTSIACRLFDAGLCRCTDYANRLKRVPDCVRLTPDNVLELSWLPSTCAYRLIGQGQDLYPWHPLISGNPNSVHAVGVSVRGRTTGLETDMADEEAYFDHVLDEEP